MLEPWQYYLLPKYLFSWTGLDFLFGHTHVSSKIVRVRLRCQSLKNFVRFSIFWSFHHFDAAFIFYDKTMTIIMVFSWMFLHSTLCAKTVTIIMDFSWMFCVKTVKIMMWKNADKLTGLFHRHFLLKPCQIIRFVSKPWHSLVVKPLQNVMVLTWY